MKLLSLVLCLAALLFADGCSKQEHRAPSGGTGMQIEPGTGVGPIKFGMTIEQVKEALGPGANTPGHAIQYPTLGLAVLPGKDGTVGAIMIGDMGGGKLSKVFQGSMKSGIRLGATRDQIVSALGQPEKAELVPTGDEELRYDGGRTTLSLKNGKLVHIILKR